MVAALIRCYRGGAAVAAAGVGAAAVCSNPMTEYALQQQLITPNGKLYPLFLSLETYFSEGNPQSVQTAFDIIQKAVAAVNIDIGYGSTLPDGTLILKNAQGVMTALTSEGSILVARGETILLWLVPK